MDPRVGELHCIMPIANLGSVVANGILSHEMVARLPHASVAMQAVQDRRDIKRVPGGLRLHQYANLYIHARNPMLYKRLNEAASICVLRVTLDVLAIPGTVIADCNAASDYVRFLDPGQWRLVAFDDVLADDWRHPGDTRRYWQHKSRKYAEVLVPHRVPPEAVVGAYVANPTAREGVSTIAARLNPTIVPHMFFS